MAGLNQGQVTGIGQSETGIKKEEMHPHPSQWKQALYGDERILGQNRVKWEIVAVLGDQSEGMVD
jgi:hypothetical protein